VLVNAAAISVGSITTRIGLAIAPPAACAGTPHAGLTPSRPGARSPWVPTSSSG
jgi:hypothetical protein